MDFFGKFFWGLNFWGFLRIFVFDEQKQENLGRISNFFLNLYEFLVFWNEICLQRRSSVDFERQRKDLDDDKCELRKRKHLHNSDKLGFWQRKCESKRHPSDKQHLLDP